MNNYIVIPAVIIIGGLFLYYIKNSLWPKKSNIPPLNSIAMNTMGKPITTTNHPPYDKTKYKACFVNYATNWCPISREFQPTWNEFSNEVLIKHPDVHMMNIICEGENEAVCKSYGASAFPTQVLYIGDKAIKFDRPRNIVSFMEFLDFYLRGSCNPNYPNCKFP